MKIARLLSIALVVGAFDPSIVLAEKQSRQESGIDLAQVPKWSRADLDFFLHGSMSTEVVPERVLQAFMATYPDLFPNQDLSDFGLLPDSKTGLPIGVSRREVPHLGRLSSIGVNCASCHVGEINQRTDAKPLRVLGMTSQFDAEAFFGAVVVATFRTSEPANMKRYLANYLAASDSNGAIKTTDSLAMELQRQNEKITEIG